ncbi:MAG TPA: hypothetical protein VHD76_07780 [Bryobacteraceae bacterium]|jgi:hypothetical protein|nr:hypothetical protein [Bryobacteraceae bacterium]
MKKLLALALLAMTPVFAADLSGVWQADVDLDAGSGTATFQFKQTGDALDGTYSGQLGSAKVTGTVNGDQVTWSFHASAQGQDIEVHYAGGIAADGTISGKCEYGELASGTFKAKRNPPN